MSLLELVDALTLPDQNRVRQELSPSRQNTVTIELPSLLNQLEDAIRGTIAGRTSGASDASSRNVIDSDALYQFSLIAITIQDWCFLAGLSPRKDPNEGLRAWYVASLAWTDFNPEWYEAKLAGWVRMIRAKLNPRRKVELMDACPECGEVDWINPNGEREHAMVLTYNPDPGLVFPSAIVQCRACDGEWAGLTPIREVAWTLEQIRE